MLELAGRYHTGVIRAGYDKQGILTDVMVRLCIFDREYINKDTEEGCRLVLSRDVHQR